MLLIKLTFLDKCCFCFLHVGPVECGTVGCLVKADTVIKNACEEKKCQDHDVSLMVALKYSGALLREHSDLSVLFSKLHILFLQGEWKNSVIMTQKSCLIYKLAVWLFATLDVGFPQLQNEKGLDTSHSSACDFITHL